MKKGELRNEEKEESEPYVFKGDWRRNGGVHKRGMGGCTLPITPLCKLQECY